MKKNIRFKTKFLIWNLKNLVLNLISKKKIFLKKKINNKNIFKIFD